MTHSAAAGKDSCPHPDGLVATDTELPQDPEFHMGGGGLYATVGDYLKFTRMILHGGTLNGAQVLKPETVATDVAATPWAIWRAIR